MPKRTIDLIPGHYYHIYNRAVSDNQLFIEDKNYHFFISKIKKYLLDSVDVLAYCLMPNHYHILVQLITTDLPKAMQQLALSYSASFNKEYQRTGHLFQGRYQLKPVNDQIYLDHLSRYIHLNPCSSGYVYKPEHWEYSSYQEFIGIQKTDFIKIKIILDLFGSGDVDNIKLKQNEYQAYVEDSIT